ncbi:MAG: urea amidolyase, partial [Verrucomicrobiota bacterium]|nr:urea amidolyase [Verrucomicrobiota bacterium]
SHGILRIVRGADWHRFEKDSISSFLIEKFSVTDDANRMGIRLEGTSLSRADAGDLASEAVVPGTIQVPPNGQPILLLGDCQTIGGYPKIAHVITVDLSATAQLRPGDAIRFAEVSLAEAQQLLLERETETARFRMGLLLLIG